MPRYHVKDDQGNTLTLEGDSPPTEQELEDIFSQYGKQSLVRNSSVEPAQVPDTVGSNISDVSSEGHQKVKEQMAQEMGQLREAGKVSDFLTSLATGAEAALPTGFNIANAPGNLVNAVAGRPVVAPFKGVDFSGLSDALMQPIEEAAGIPGGLTGENSPAHGIGQTADALASGLTTPDVALTLPAYASGIPEALALPATIARGALATDVLAHLPGVHAQESQVFANPNSTTSEKARAASGQIASDLIAAAMTSAVRGGAIKGGENNASQISQAAEVHGDVQPARAEAQDVQQNQPGSGQGIRAQAGGGLQEGQVAASPEHQKFGSDYVAGNGEAAARTRLTQLDREAAAATASGDQARAQEVAGRANGLRQALGEPAKPVEQATGPLSPQENQHFEQLQNDYYSGHDMSPEDTAAHAAYEARVKANAPVVERQEVPYTEAESEFKQKAGAFGYQGDVAFVPEANMAPGDQLRSSWAIWNPRSGRIEVNADAWNRLSDEGRRKLVDSVTSEEVVHSHTDDAEAEKFRLNSTGVQRWLNRKMYGMGAGDVRMDNRVLGHEMVRIAIQRLNGITRTEAASLKGLQGLTVRGMDTLDNIINKTRQALGTEASQRQLEVLDKVQENIGAARVAMQSGALQSPQRQQEKANDIADEIGHTFKPVGTFHPEGMPPELVAQLQPLADKYGWEFTNKKTGITFYTRKGASPAEIADAYKAKYGQEMPGQALASPQRPEKTQEIKDTEEKLGLRHDGTVAGHNQWTIMRNGVEESTFITKKDASLDQIKTKMDAIEAGTLAAPQRGMSAAEQRRIEEQRKYREAMIAKGEGQTGTMAERHAAAYAPPTPESIQNIADQVISTKEPSKSAFVSAVRTRHGDIQPGQVEDMWADAVNKKLASASGKELEDMVENLGLRRQVFGQTTSSGKGFGLPEGPRVRINNKGTIADATTPETRTAQQAASEQAIKLLERATDLESKARIAKTQIDTASFNQKAAILRRAADNLKAAAETGEGLQMDQPSLFPGVAEQQATYTRGTEIKGKPQRAEIERGGQVKARERAMSAIFRKLVGEEPAASIRAGLTRKEITPQDIRWTDPRISEGSSGVIRVTEPDLEDTSELGMRLTEGAGTSASTTRMSAGGERKFKREALPRSATKRVVALLDKRTKQVHLVSAYRDGHRGPVFLDPSSVTKEHRTLDQLVGRYRPLYSVPLDRPVKDFKQTFKSVKDFSEKFSGQIQRVANRIGERGMGSEPFIEGTPGLEGEGGIAQGPDAGWMRDALGMTTGTLESGAKLTGLEARAAYQAFRFIESPDDAAYVISQLRKRAEKNLLRPKDRVLISAMSKVNDALIEKHAGEGLTPGQLYEETLNELYSLAQRTTKQAAFVDAAARDFAQGHGLPPEAQAQAPSPFSRELTMPIDRVPPTTVRPEQVPPGSKPVPTGATGNEQVPPRDLPPPGAQRIIYETIHRQLRQEANKPATPEEQALRMRLLDQRAQQKAADIERMRKAMLKPAQPKEAGPQGELGLAAPRRGEDVNPDVESPIPRFIHNASSALTQASGIERIPLVGKLWSDRARIQGPEDREIVAYSVKRQIGNSQAAIVGARMAALNEKLGTPFKQDHNGKITNLDAPFEQSKYPSDVFEDWQRQTIVPEKMYASRAFTDSEISAYSERHPSTVKLTPAQDKFFRAMLGVVEDGYKYLDEKNAKLDMHNGESMETRRDQILMKGLPSGVEVYPLSRVALFKRAVGPVATEIRRRIGGQYSVERDRLYNTEREGQPTTAYEPDMTKRLTTFVARVYKSVADADLANSPALRGETPAERAPRLGKEYQEDLLSGRMKPGDIEEMSRHPRLGIEAEVHGHPAFAGKIYPQDIANKLNKAFGESSHRWVRTAGELNKLSKALMLTGDLAQYLQQGSAIMFSHPRVWTDATIKSLQSIGRENVTGKYLLNPENMKAATEFVQSGGSLGHLQDFMAGSDPGEIATKIPGFRQVVIRSGRAFGTFLDISKIEMWKALKDVTPRNEWPGVIEMIENSAMSGKMESAGMNPARAVGERIAFMASSYYRGALNLVAGMAERGVAGREARKTIGSYAAGMTLGMVSLYLAAGMSWEEIRKRLTPGQDNQKFLKFPVKIGGDTVEIGPGGILLSLANLGADVAVTSATHPANMVSFGEKNPLIKWLTMRLGPVPSALRKVVTGQDVFGRPVNPIEAVASTATPIPVQKGYQALRSANVGAGALSAGSSFFGLDSQKYHAASEIYDLAQKYMEAQGLKKDSGWDEVQNDEPSYTKLRGAISGGSQRRFNDIYKKMSETHTDWEMVRSMRQWAQSPFTGSRKAEQMFRSELTDYQDKVYEQAKDERERVLEDFMDMMDHTP